jgi:hypothetical protein
MKLRAAVLSGMVLSALGAPGSALVETALAQSRWDQAAVVAAFRSQLRRDPTPLELRRYSMLVDRYDWTVADVKRDLAERQDYRRYTRGSWDADAAVRRAYLDILGREPDPAGLRTYREQIIRNGWSEWDLREELRRSPEYRATDFRTASADRIVRNAYQDILKREPDPEGLSNYRRMILEEGWDAQDVRWALRQSEERRDLRQGIREERRELRVDQMEAMVRTAYLSVLRREPDPEGLREYTERIRRDGWTQRDVEKALLDSDEYRRLRR